MRLITNRIFTGKPTKTIPELLKMAQAKSKLEKTASVQEEVEVKTAGDKEWFEKNVLNKKKEEGEVEKEGTEASASVQEVKLAEDKKDKGVETYDAGKVEGKLVGDPEECKDGKNCKAEKEEDPAPGGVGTTKTQDGTFPSSGQLDPKVDGNKNTQPKPATEKNDKAAASTGKVVEARFERIANLTDKQKSFLKTYWRNLYGEAYADAMVADK